MSRYFGIIIGVFLFVSTMGTISIMFDSDVGQYLSILAMIGLCTSYAILALFDCCYCWNYPVKLNMYFKQFRNIELQSPQNGSKGFPEGYYP